MLAVVILLAVFILIAVRQIGSFRVGIWQAMLGGALAALATGQIAPDAALASINGNVLLFLACMFVIGGALEESGYLAFLSGTLFGRAKTGDALLLAVLVGAGVASAFLMNDTLAIIGTPVVLGLARQHGMPPKGLLLALAAGITIGSVMSPIGNPQNLLIALQMKNPFLTFLRYLALPTLASMAAAFFLIRRLYPAPVRRALPSRPRIRDRQLARLCAFSLFILVSLVALKIALAFAGIAALELVHIAVAAAFPIVVFGKNSGRIVAGIDWRTLIFFASMFVLMESVWLSGFFQPLVGHAASLGTVLLVGVVLSQFISNVPLVALYLPVLAHAGADARLYAALAAGSTIAGNLTILGAASNVIIIQAAERRGETVTFMEFLRLGIPLTLVAAAIYFAFLAWL